MQEAADKKKEKRVREEVGRGGCGHGGRNERTTQNSDALWASITWWAESKWTSRFVWTNNQSTVMLLTLSPSCPPGTCNLAAMPTRLISSTPQISPPSPKPLLYIYTPPSPTSSITSSSRPPFGFPELTIQPSSLATPTPVGGLSTPMPMMEDTPRASVGFSQPTPQSGAARFIPNTKSQDPIVISISCTTRSLVACGRYSG